MNNLLVIAGIAIIIIALWRDRGKENSLQKDIEDQRKLLGEITDAKKEIRILLSQLEAASDKIVDEIANGLKEIEAQVASSYEQGKSVENTGNNKQKGRFRTIRSPQRQRVDTASESNQLQPKHLLVYNLAEMGYSEEEIAKELKMGKGEVSLLLQLRRKGEEGNV